MTKENIINEEGFHQPYDGPNEPKHYDEDEFPSIIEDEDDDLIIEEEEEECL